MNGLLKPPCGEVSLVSVFCVVAFFCLKKKKGSCSSLFLQYLALHSVFVSVVRLVTHLFLMLEND